MIFKTKINTNSLNQYPKDRRRTEMFFKMLLENCLKNNNLGHWNVEKIMVIEGGVCNEKETEVSTS